jgi:DNA-binding MarR family transcriptional regulator
VADDRTLGDLLMRVARTLRHRWRAALAPWDLSPHQARALRVVCESDGVRLSDLAEALRIAPRSATEVADGLQERGLVQRAADPSDHRAAATTELFERLTPADRAELERILRLLTD